ncbi:MAG: hypothetical protein ABIY51_13380 [Ferruginibacter sp.]
MKNRILSGWTFRRALYAGIGIFIIIESIMQHQWFGILFGGYFASMGIFAFGCAAGNCFGGNCNVEPTQKNKSQIQCVELEKVK